MGELILAIPMIIIGVVLLVFHRPIARWQQSQWRDSQVWPFSRMATPRLYSYIVPLVAAGLGFIIAGVLALVEIGHWKK